MNFALIFEYLQNLVPSGSRRLRRLAAENGNVVENVDTEKLAEMGLLDQLREQGFDVEKIRQHYQTEKEEKAPKKQEKRGDTTSPRHIGRRLQAVVSTSEFGEVLEKNPKLRKDIGECLGKMMMNSSQSTGMDLCCAAHGNTNCSPISDEMEVLVKNAAVKSGLMENNSKDSAEEREAEAEKDVEMSIEPRGMWFATVLNNLYYASLGQQVPPGHQWAATFPPTLPNVANPFEVAKYSLTYMTSLWHQGNTAPMGVVVDSNFDVMGAQGLAIIDASVLNVMTRMNPIATLMTLGAYGGVRQLAQKGIPNPMGPFIPPAP